MVWRVTFTLVSLSSETCCRGVGSPTVGARSKTHRSVAEGEGTAGFLRGRLKQNNSSHTHTHTHIRSRCGITSELLRTTRLQKHKRGNTHLSPQRSPPSHTPAHRSGALRRGTHTHTHTHTFRRLCQSYRERGHVVRFGETLCVSPRSFWMNNFPFAEWKKRERKKLCQEFKSPL